MNACTDSIYTVHLQDKNPCETMSVLPSLCRRNFAKVTHENTDCNRKKKHLHKDARSALSLWSHGNGKKYAAISLTKGEELWEEMRNAGALKKSKCLEVFASHCLRLKLFWQKRNTNLTLFWWPFGHTFFFPRRIFSYQKHRDVRFLPLMLALCSVPEHIPGKIYSMMHAV